MPANLTLSGPILSWDEGIPLGNGKLGCLIWGRLSHLRFSLDQAGLWDLRPAPGSQNSLFTYAGLTDMVKRKDTEKIREIFEEPYANATPTKLPVGAFYLSGLEEGEYNAELDLKSATAVILAKGIRMKFWIATQRSILVLEAEGENAPLIKMKAAPPAYDCENKTVSDPLTRSLNELGYTKAEIIEDGIFSGFVQPIAEGEWYCALSCQYPQKEKTIFFCTVWRGKSKEKAIVYAVNDLLVQRKVSLEKIYGEHLAWWEDYWNCSSVEIPDEALMDIWYRGLYLLGACSRKGEAPAPLQGLWTADNGNLPPWKGDYHNDLNTQFTYASYLTSNHLPQGEAFLDFLWKLQPKAREFAEKFYNTKGACLPGVMDLQGNALGGWPMYSLSPTNYIWLCQMFHEYYRITGNKEFLKERVWPIFCSCEECIRGLLIQREDGKLYLPLSSSPEIFDNTMKSWLEPDSNYDLALLRYLYQTLATLASELHYPVEYWKKQLAKLPEFSVEADGTLMYCKEKRVEESHRHFSHTLGIYPLRLIRRDKKDEKEIIEHSIQRIETLGTSKWVGFSFAWFAMLKTLQKDGVGAAKLLNILCAATFSPNGFHLNGDYKGLGISDFHYRPFTLETNFFAIQVINEMLLYSQNGEIEIFPAVVSGWEEYSFSHLRAEKGLLVSAARSKTGKISAYLYAQQEGTWYIKNINRHLKLEKNKSIQLEFF